MSNTHRKIGTVEVEDPTSILPVEVEIFLSPGGGMWGIDSSFLANTDEPVYNPFDGKLLKEQEDFLPCDGKFPYTVLLLYPPEMTDGDLETYLAHVDAFNAEEAVKAAFEESPIDQYDEGIPPLDDPNVLLVAEGHIENAEH